MYVDYMSYMSYVKQTSIFFMERLKHSFFVSKKFGIFLLLYKDRKTKL